MLNKQWHVSPPALKATDPVGPHTYTLFVFPVIFLIAVTSVLMSVLLPLPATPHKVILKGVKFSCILEELAISNHFLKYCRMYDNTFFGLHCKHQWNTFQVCAADSIFVEVPILLYCSLLF